MKGQFDSVVVIIHASQNPYTIASLNFVLIDVETRHFKLLFDSNVYANVTAVNSPVLDKSVQSQDSDNFVVKNFSAAPHISDCLLPTSQGHPDNQQYGNNSYG